MPYEAERDAAVEAALHAGSLIRAHAGRLDADDVRLKNPRDPVTVVDEAAQQAITDRLRAAFPGDGILAEEGDAYHAPAPDADGRRWIIDPLDGTTNFTHNLPPYAVSIGLQEGPQMVVGVVYEVARDELFVATRGGGLFLNGRRTGASTRAAMGECLLVSAFPSRSYAYADAYVATMRRLMSEVHAVRRPGAAAVDIAYVACGRFDAFFGLGLSPWDVAAGWLLVEEGGGHASDFEGRPFAFGDDLAVSNGPIHEAFLEGLRPLRSALQG